MSCSSNDDSGHSSADGHLPEPDNWTYRSYLSRSWYPNCSEKHCKNKNLEWIIIKDVKRNDANYLADVYLRFVGYVIQIDCQ
jgi:hypothetical protein